MTITVMYGSSILRDVSNIKEEQIEVGDTATCLRDVVQWIWEKYGNPFDLFLAQDEKIRSRFVVLVNGRMTRNLDLAVQEQARIEFLRLSAGG